MSATTSGAGTTPTRSSEEGSAQKSQGVSLETFLASFSVAAIVFGVELVIFILARKRLARIYEPRTYLVPEKRRTPISGDGLLDWIMPIFKTSTSDFIQKSGLDAYFFLRYLLMLLKIFSILAAAILPILIPLNTVGGQNDHDPDPAKHVLGMDRYAWANVAPGKYQRYWGHLVLAIFTVFVCCYMFYRELRVYIRLRQAYLTSPQHRLRASATTVLITSIPRKWLSINKLLGLYDVFPGGVRNIWINRDYDELAEKVAERDRLARKLEAAETDLIRMAKKRHMKKMKKEAKSNLERQNFPANKDMSNEGGMSSGNPHQIPQQGFQESESDPKKKKILSPVFDPIAGGVTGGMDKIGSGIKGVSRKVKSIVPGNHQAHGFMSESEGDDTSREGGHNVRTKRGSTLGSNPDAEANGSRAQSKPWTGKVRLSEDDERPLASPSSMPPRPSTASEAPPPEENGTTEYPPAYDPAYEDFDGYGEPVWKNYLNEKDRPTHRLPLFGFSWMPELPLVGKKVDTIHYCRKEVARLNVEIEQDQSEPEKFPLMNSAFIQFNNQVAAHMACQSLNHHIPQQMGPRYLEVNPNDVIWENMRIKWWERYIRITLVTCAVAGLIIGWATPVAFVGAISQVSYLSETVPFLKFINDFPNWLLGLISGILPPLGLAILMALLPIILRTLARLQGMHTGMTIELAVQGMYFGFLFVQVFLVVSISSGMGPVLDALSKNPTAAASILAENLPKASNFFFSYLLLQAFAQSGGALMQIGSLIVYYIMAPIFDSTARQKWQRQVALPEMKWGTFFPIYTNLACIGLVYSVISPLILIFNIFTFGLFWIVYRYNLLFVTNFKFDTGGLLFPRAINQLFTGLYIMEVCLIGLFFLVQDENGDVACFPQAIIMVMMAALTFLYQRTLNKSFGPLLTYLPITLEDDAAERDRVFAMEHDEHRRLALVEGEHEGEDVNQLLERRENLERAADNHAEKIEVGEIEANRQAKKVGRQPIQRTANKDRWSASDPHMAHSRSKKSMDFKRLNQKLNPFNQLPVFKSKDLEAQEAEKVANLRRANRAEFVLFDDIPDEIEDLSSEERDRLVARAFQHEALRAKRPVIWIPRDDLGISEDEIFRTRNFSKHIWVSNEYAGLDDKVRVVYRRSPPDFDARDLVEL
ncbi:DUF221 domain-containing protein [Tirmania nivea]|nr:DUF221 domain-containing protein [Tirmania nivea]